MIMRNWSKLLLLLAFPLFIAACSKSDDPPGTNDTLTTILTQGTWTVHSYKNNGTDETSNYAGYVFTFNTNGSLMAEKTGNNTTGTWTEATDYYGKTTLALTWSGGGIPVELLKFQVDWILKSKSSTLVELTNTGGSGTSELHLHKQ
jgi:hypothetical protein